MLKHNPAGIVTVSTSDVFSLTNLLAHAPQFTRVINTQVEFDRAAVIDNFLDGSEITDNVFTQPLNRRQAEQVADPTGNITVITAIALSLLDPAHPSESAKYLYDCFLDFGDPAEIAAGDIDMSVLALADNDTGYWADQHLVMALTTNILGSDRVTFTTRCHISNVDCDFEMTRAFALPPADVITRDDADGDLWEDWAAIHMLPLATEADSNVHTIYTTEITDVDDPAYRWLIGKTRAAEG